MTGAMWNKDIPDDPRDKGLDELVPGWRDMPLDQVKAELARQQQELQNFIERLRSDS